jgi:hypothetical protein
MDLTRARRDVFNAEKMLADCMVCEHKVMVNLSKHKFDISKQKLAKAEAGMGHMWIAFKKHGLSHCGPVPSDLQLKGKFLIAYYLTMLMLNIESFGCHHITVQLD